MHDHLLWVETKCANTCTNSQLRLILLIFELAFVSNTSNMNYNCNQMHFCTFIWIDHQVFDHRKFFVKESKNASKLLEWYACLILCLLNFLSFIIRLFGINEKRQIKRKMQSFLWGFHFSSCVSNLLCHFQMSWKWYDIVEKICGFHWSM